ncbi:MAG: CBS domain-containing protein [Candidatus Obscuribacterales bacterium]
MEIILTHNNMDFDSLAAQFAVSKLYPSARMILGYPLVGNVRNFVALYRSSMPVTQMKYVDVENVRRIFIVDCQNVERLDEIARKMITEQKIPHVVFDHHQFDPNGLGPTAQEDSVIERVGSATTIVVDKIMSRNIHLTPFEATLMAIGIYEDTGCLTYSGTTDKDAACVAYLLKQGADLAIINDYIRPKMNDDQIGLLEDLIKDARVITVGGARVIVAVGSRDKYFDGVASLTRKLTEVESADAAFSVVHMRDRVHIVGRSDSHLIDVRLVVRKFGGDGHHGAGSAVTRNGTVESIAAEIEKLLRKQVKPEVVAEEIMISPVRTIRSNITMDEASRIMLRYGLDGVLVADEDSLVGVVSRRDIDQAKHHKLGHAPVRGFMSKPVISIDRKTPLSKIQQIMVTEDIGRLPVLDEEKQLVGLVSRGDVLKTLYGDNGSKPFLVPEWATLLKNDFAASGSTVHLEPRSVNLQKQMSTLDTPTSWLCVQTGKVAAQLNMVAYAVGGSVRDLILKVPNYDLDFVIEGAAIDLANAMESAYPARLEVVARHERFQTAKLWFYADTRRDIDFSTARTEFYEFPAALPTVEASQLEQDLLRRDFTINALAICLNPGRYGMLVDHFGGLEDLKKKTIRVLHAFSFIEDPTRIIRAVRFASRLEFNIEPKTKELAKRAVAMGIFDNLGGSRMRDELRSILESPRRIRALDLLAELGAKLRYLDAELEYQQSIRTLLRRAEGLMKRYTLGQPWVVYLALLLSQLDEHRIDVVLDRLHLTNEQKAIVRKGLAIPRQLPEVVETLNKQGVKNSQIYYLLKGKPEESLAIAACLASPGAPLRRMIRLYLEHLEKVQIELTGADLVELGVAPGPEIGRALDAILERKLDGLIFTRQDELDYVKERFQSKVAIKEPSTSTSTSAKEGTSTEKKLIKSTRKTAK